MASTCFCGCERPIEGLRARANNTVAEAMARDLAVIEGAARHGDADGDPAALDDLAAEGRRHLDAIRAFLHGEIGRDALDKDGAVSWSKQASEVRAALTSPDGPGAWRSREDRSADLPYTGVRAPGVIADVRRTGGNAHRVDLDLVASVRTADGSILTVTGGVTALTYEAPRVGDAVEVAYDPDEPTALAFRPMVQLPPASS